MGDAATWNCIFDCPEQRKVSPKRTLVINADSPLDPANAKVHPTAEAGVAGSRIRHTLPSSAVALNLAVGAPPPDIVAVTAVPAGAKPQSAACCGARCSTMFDPSVAERKRFVGGGGGTNGTGCVALGQVHIAGNFLPQSGQLTFVAAVLEQRGGSRHSTTEQLRPCLQSCGWNGGATGE